MNKYAVIGLGYVGLRAALSLSKHQQEVIGFDISKTRLKELGEGFDCNLDIPQERLSHHRIFLTDNPAELAKADFFIIDIGTPINNFYVPDMSALKSVCRQLGTTLKKGDTLVFESTVYPGATEEVFIPILEKISGLQSGTDFFVGYSPERIVPGDVQHDVTNTKKIISGQNAEALRRIREAYAHVVDSELVSVPSIKTAEAVKILENIQRDVNIAVMNEFAQVMERIGVNMNDVLKGAATKWNFLPFKPGLVGGHCISVDPYYLIHKARALHMDTDLMSTARKVNENFVHFIVDIVTHKVIGNYQHCKNLNAGLLGLTYKKNVADVRNSLSFHIYDKLTAMGFNMVAHDPWALIRGHEGAHVHRVEWEALEPQQVLIIAIDHDDYLDLGLKKICDKLLPNGLLFDITGMFYNQPLPRKDIIYWSL